MQAVHRPLLSPAQGWTLVAAVLLAGLGLAFRPPQPATSAATTAVSLPAVSLPAVSLPAVAQDNTAGQTRIIPTISAGGNADSNNSMIAVTGLDVTGQSVLYLVDTVNLRLAIYQAAGGASSTQNVRLVGVRNISLDLQLDGFNDETETKKGEPLPFKALEKQFVDAGLLSSSEND